MLFVFSVFQPYISQQAVENIAWVPLAAVLIFMAGLCFILNYHQLNVCQGATIPLKYILNDLKNEFVRIQHWVRPNTLGNKRGGVPKRGQGGHLCQNQ